MPPPPFAPPIPQTYPHAVHSPRAAAGATTQKSRALGVVLAIIFPGLQRIYYGDNAAMGMLQLFLAYMFYVIGFFMCFPALIAVAISAWAIYEAATLPIE